MGLQIQPHVRYMAEHLTQTLVMCYALSHFSHVGLFVTPETAACQAPLSMEVSRQEHWSG